MSLYVAKRLNTTPSVLKKVNLKLDVIYFRQMYI